MCVTSMIGDYYQDKWFPDKKNEIPRVIAVGISREEFDNLKKEVLEMKELLKRALEYDKLNNQPECYNDDKWKMLKSVAEYVGVDLNDVLDKANKYDGINK